MRTRLVSATLAAVLLFNTHGAAGQAAPGREPRAAQPQRTVADFERAVERAPGDARLLLALGLAYWDRNESSRALEIFQRAVTLAPSSSEAHNWLGVALAEKADLAGAIVMLTKAIALDPGYGRAYANLGSALAAKGDLVDAIAVFRKGSRSSPTARPPT